MVKVELNNLATIAFSLLSLSQDGLKLLSQMDIAPWWALYGMGWMDHRVGRGKDIEHLTVCNSLTKNATRNRTRSANYPKLLAKESLIQFDRIIKCTTNG